MSERATPNRGRAATATRAAVVRRDMDVAALVRDEMRMRRIPQRDLARELGISEMAVSRRMHGHVPLSAAELVTAAEILGVSIDRLLGRAA